ncbi:hypothetical protein P7H50_10045 [Enterococcus durans]|nr:hypothetical protein [Enterococcus durans]
MKNWRKKRLGQKQLLISEGVASAPTVYSFLNNETKVFLIFVPRSSVASIQEIKVKNESVQRWLLKLPEW